MFGASVLALVAAEPLLPSPYAPRIHVRWDDGLAGEERRRLDAELRLAQPELTA